MAYSDVEHWQCDKTLPQCMGYMLDNQIMCDVTFMLGEERHEVHAHKYMLASRSPVFHAMLGGPLAERGKIEIPDIDKDIFKAFLRYLYTDDVSLTAENVLQIMYASKKYCIDLLTKLCKDFLQDNITTESACALMDGALKLQEEDIYKSCMEKIKENTESCITSSTFTTISKEALKSITQLEDVLLKEEVLYEQVMKWCDAECGRQHIEVTWENKRKLLGDILYNIRFPLMDSKYFAKEMKESGLLTEKEKNEIMYHHILQETTPKSSFNYRKRHVQESEIQCVIRFSSYMYGSDWNLSGEIDAIDFKTSHGSNLYGILVYGAYHGSCTYKVDINVKDSTGILLTHKTQIDSNNDIEMHEIKFKEPLKIKANAIFCLELLMIGGSSKRGENGQRVVPYACGTKTVTFLASSSSKNCTSISNGQIPGLLLT